MNFEKCTEVWTRTDQPYASIIPSNPVFFQVGTSTPAGPQVQGQWFNVDMTPWGIPVDAKAVQLQGLMIITKGTNAGTADLMIAFRRFGDTTADPNKYLGQCVEACYGGGQRSTFSCVVPMADGKIEYAVKWNDPIGWPAGHAYGINLTVGAYFR